MSKCKKSDGLNRVKNHYIQEDESEQKNNELKTAHILDRPSKNQNLSYFNTTDVKEKIKEFSDSYFEKMKKDVNKEESEEFE